MGLLEDIKSCFGGEEIFASFRVTLFGDGKLYIEGVKSIRSYTREKMELRLKSGGLIITGDELFVKKYCAEDLAVCGKIKSLEKI